MLWGSLEVASCFFLNISWNSVVAREPITGGIDCSLLVNLTALIYAVTAGPTSYLIWKVPWRRAFAVPPNPILL